MDNHCPYGDGREMNRETRFYYDSLRYIKEVFPEVAKSMVDELEYQRTHLKMIASENYSSFPVQACMNSLLNDKYAEGYPHHRYYAGCENIDTIEDLAAREAEELFGADYAYVQPHCGSDANMIAYWAVLDHRCLAPAFEMIKEKTGAKNYSELTEEQWSALRELCHNQKMLSMDYYSGSHLTHGYRQNISAQLFDCHYYGVGEDGLIDYDEIERKLEEVKPLILLAGYSAYPRAIDFRRLKDLAERNNATLVVDMAHFCGLVAGKALKDQYNPVPYADIVTSTTHKTLRGPRGGLILCKEEFRSSVNKGCPLVMGGQLPQMVAAKAVAFREAGTEEFREYSRKVVENAKALASSLVALGCSVVTGGTDNHMVILDVSPFGLNGRQAESILYRAGICCNRQAIPNDPNGVWYTSGLRLGTPALTTLGIGGGEIQLLAYTIVRILGNCRGIGKSKAEVVDFEKFEEDRTWVRGLLEKHPVYRKVDLGKLRRLVDR